MTCGDSRSPCSCAVFASLMVPPRPALYPCDVAPMWPPVLRLSGVAFRGDGVQERRQALIRSWPEVEVWARRTGRL